MPGPWDNYAAPATPSGPWQNYQPQPSVGDYAADAAMSLGTGLVHSASGIVGLPGLAAQGAVHAGQIIPGLGLRWSTPEEKAAGHGNIVSDQGYQETVKAVDKAAPTPGNIEKAWLAPDALHTPLYGPGKVAETAGEMTLPALATALSGGAAGPALVPAITKAAVRYIAAPTTLSTVGGAIGDRFSPQAGDIGRTAGAILGSLGGGASEVASATTSGLARANQAFDDLVRMSGQSPAEIKAALAVHPELWPADVMPSAQTALLGMSRLPGPGQSVAVDAAKARAARIPSMAVDTSNAAMGMPVSAVSESKRLADVANDNARTGFATALTGSGPVIVEPVIAKIDSLLGSRFVNGQPTTNLTTTPAQAELLKIRDSLSGEAIRDPNTGALLKPPNPQTYERDPMALHQLQQRIRQTATGMASSGDPLVRQYAKPIGDIRQSLIKEIDTASGGGAGTPGPYRQAQLQYADDKAVQDAYAKGWQFDKKPSGLEGELTDSPEALAQWWDGANDPQRPWLDPATPDEKAAFQAGARARQAQIQATNQNAIRLGRAPTDTEYGRDKLAIAFGPAGADQMATDYNSMRTMAETNNLAMNKGSPTAQAMAGISLLQQDPKFANAGEAIKLGLMPQFLTADLLARGDLPNAVISGVGGAALAGGRLAASKIAAGQRASGREMLAHALTLRGQDAIDAVNAAEQRMGSRVGPTNAALARALVGASGNAWPVSAYSQPSRR